MTSDDGGFATPTGSEVSSIRAHSITDTLRGLNDIELIKTVEDLKIEIYHLELENQIFENFLLKNDPVLISGIAQVLEVAGKIQSKGMSTLTPTGERRETLDSMRSSSRKTESAVRFTTASASTSERMPRVNLSQKTELAIREMEDVQAALQKFINISHKRKWNLKADLEEVSIRESEVKEARELFEQKIVLEGVDFLTQRIPAEKFLRYMDEWLKSAESTVEKLRLRTSTLKIAHKKISTQLIQKQELGETIDAVDFDQLRIENSHLAKTIDLKNNHLLELKQMNGTANLVLTTNKKYLLKQVQDIHDINDAINHKEQQVMQLDEETERVEKQVFEEREKYENIYDLLENYEVPNLMEYVKTKAALVQIKKIVKIWERRNNIDNFALNTNIRHMKKLTGFNNIHPSWFKIKSYSEISEDNSALNLSLGESSICSAQTSKTNQ